MKRSGRVFGYLRSRVRHRGGKVLLAMVGVGLLMLVYGQGRVTGGGSLDERAVHQLLQHALADEIDRIHRSPRPGAFEELTGRAVGDSFSTSVPFSPSGHSAHYLRPQSILSMPERLRAALEQRGCLIPQASLAARPNNVIRGAFLGEFSSDWAVLCSQWASSEILVFPNGDPEQEISLARVPDATYLITDGAGAEQFSRAISPVDEAFIRERWAAYGGKLPPTIDHEGINDAFEEKGSIVHYHHGGQWLELSGSD